MWKREPKHERKENKNGSEQMEEHLCYDLSKLKSSPRLSNWESRRRKKQFYLFFLYFVKLYMTKVLCCFIQGLTNQLSAKKVYDQNNVSLMHGLNIFNKALTEKKT